MKSGRILYTPTNPNGDDEVVTLSTFRKPTPTKSTRVGRYELSAVLERKLDRYRRIQEISDHARRFRTATPCYIGTVVYIEVDRLNAPTLVQTITNNDPAMPIRTAVHACIQWYSDLIDSINILQTHNIRPVQICADTVIICNDFPVLTDFSEADERLIYGYALSIQHSNVTPSLPMEMHLLSFANRKKLAALSLANIEEVVDEVMQTTTVGTDNIDTGNAWRAEVISYFFKFVNRPIGQLCDHHLDPELFAVSAMFLPLVAHVCTRSDAGPFLPILATLSEILRDGCHPLPEHRVSRTQIRHRLDVVMGRTL